MTLEFLQRHWALAAASILVAAIVLFAAWRAWLDSPRGRLHLAQRRLRKKELEARRQQKRLARLSAQLDSLRRKADTVKPIRLQETAEAVQDAEALLKIADDQVLIAGNHVRKIIVEEFPPKRHDRMRSKYLPGEQKDDRPIRF